MPVDIYECPHFISVYSSFQHTPDKMFPNHRTQVIGEVVYDVLDKFGLDRTAFAHFGEITTEPLAIFGGIASQIARDKSIVDVDQRYGPLAITDFLLDTANIVLPGQDLDIMVPHAICGASGVLGAAIVYYMSSRGYNVVPQIHNIKYETTHMKKNVQKVVTFEDNKDRKVQFVFLKDGRTLHEAIEGVDLSCCQAWVEFVNNIHAELHGVNEDTLTDIRLGIADALWDRRGMSHIQEDWYNARIERYIERGFNFGQKIVTLTEKITLSESMSNLPALIGTLRGRAHTRDRHRDVFLHASLTQKLSSIFNVIAGPNREGIVVNVEYKYFAHSKTGIYEIAQIIGIHTSDGKTEPQNVSQE